MDRFLGYLMDPQGFYDSPVVIDSKEKLNVFIGENVEKYHELRITDADDFIVLQIISQSLVFPLLDGMEACNTWDRNLQMFVTQEKH